MNWQSRYPVGIFFDANDTDNAPKTRTLMAAAKQNNLRDLMSTNWSPYFCEALNGQSAVIDGEDFGGKVTHVIGAIGRLASGSGTGLYGDWYLRGSGSQTSSDATAMATAILAELPNRANALGYSLGDDVTTLSFNKATELAPLITAFQAADTRRFASAVVTDQGAWASLTGLQVAITYLYPCGRYANNTDTAEGDFHRSTFAGIGSGDWVDAYRLRVTGLPTGCRVWLIMQAHQNIDSPQSASQLRYPTAAEMRMQVWQAIGEGATGLYWFLWGDNGGATVGLGSVGGEARLAAAHQMADRVTPAIRNKLLAATRVSDIFAASGGGNAGYPTPYANAYISTLQQTNGRLLCVICNHASTAQNVTITAPGQTGRLVNLETGTSYAIGSAISIAGFDGTIFELDPYIGVPRVDPDFSQNVKYYWDHHWANSSATEYIAPGSLNLHPNVVTVASGDNLQTVIDAAPNGTTFRLQSGTYAAVTLVGRERLHFVADDDAHKPTVRGFYIYGCTHAQHINAEDANGIGGWVGKLINTPDPVERHNWLNPKRDFIFHNLNFVSDGTLMDYKWFYLNSTWTHDHIVMNGALMFRNVRDVCIEGCTFSGYIIGDATTQPVVAPPTGVSPTPTQVGAIAYPDCGMISGNGGINHMVVRSCTFNTTTRAGGSQNFPSGVFWDGACGCVSTNNTFNRTASASYVYNYLFLTNDDFTMDAQNDGHVDAFIDLRSARYNVCANTAGQYGSMFASYMGGKNLTIGNTMPDGGGGTLPVFVEVSARNTAKAAYDSTGNMIMNNTVTNLNYTVFVDVRNDLGDTIGNKEQFNMGEDGPVGRTTVTGNTIGGTVGSYVHTNGSTPAAVGPDVVSGNTP